MPSKETLATTLVVAPDTLVSQWAAEIAKSCDPRAPLVVRVHVLGSSSGGGGAGSAVSQVRHASASAKHAFLRELVGGERGAGDAGAAAAGAAATTTDVVLTTYRTVELDTRLQGAHWARVVLDEMQEVRSSTTQLARRCEALSADARWMVSGTPLYSSLDDLNGEVCGPP